MKKDKEEVIHKEHSNGWERDMPVTLIRYGSGGMDVHCQTGDHYPAAMVAAEAILQKRGLTMDASDKGSIAPTGVYRRVVRVAKKRKRAERPTDRTEVA